MAIKKKYPQIKRVKGMYPSNRFGIQYATLSRAQRTLLMNYPLLRDRCRSDQFVHILFEQHSYTHTATNYTNKLFYDWSTGEIVEREDLEESYQTIDWTCAISGEPIRAKMGDFSLENFVHPNYHDVLKAPMVDSRILKSSVEFRKKCKELLLNQQQEFLKLAKKNSKNSKKFLS
jgi:hypothetical protein